MSASSARPRPKVYDRAYYDRWYRHPETRLHVREGVTRKVALAVAAAEYLIQRPVRSVLDVGCGEGAWQPILAKLRPRARYQGVDSSRFAVRRWGRRRNILLGTFGGLGEVELDGPYDLIVCSDMLHYVADRELRKGLATIHELLDGVLWMEFFASTDSFTGDLHDLRHRRPERYLRLIRAAGLVHCGLFSFVRDDFAPGLTAFERGWR